MRPFTSGSGCLALRWGLGGAPFPLQSDPSPDAREVDSGIERDAQGNLRLVASGNAPLEGTWSILWGGCRDNLPMYVDTKWFQAGWDADVPAGTSLSFRAKASGAVTLADPGWEKASWTTEETRSPMSLLVTLRPNLRPGPYEGPNGVLLAQFKFTSLVAGVTPRLRAFRVGYKCQGLGAG